MNTNLAIGVAAVWVRFSPSDFSPGTAFCGSRSAQKIGFVIRSCCVGIAISELKTRFLTTAWVCFERFSKHPDPPFSLLAWQPFRAPREASNPRKPLRRNSQRLPRQPAKRVGIWVRFLSIAHLLSNSFNISTNPLFTYSRRAAQLAAPGACCYRDDLATWHHFVSVRGRRLCGLQLVAPIDARRIGASRCTLQHFTLDWCAQMRLRDGGAVIEKRQDNFLIECLNEMGVTCERLALADHRRLDDKWRQIYGDVFRTGTRHRHGAKAAHEYLQQREERWLLVPFLSNVPGTFMQVDDSNPSAFECQGRLIELSELKGAEFFISPLDFAWTFVRTHEDYGLGGPYFVRAEWVSGSRME